MDRISARKTSESHRDHFRNRSSGHRGAGWSQQPCTANRSSAGRTGLLDRPLFWGRGYCTEVGRSLLDHAFGPLGLHRIQAFHFVRNTASGRVLQKIGMRREGLCRVYVQKWNQFEDCELYGILSTDTR